MCICDLKLGEKAKIEQINGDSKLAKRLSDLSHVEGK